MRQITTGDYMHVHGGFGAGVDYSCRITVRMTEAVDVALLECALEQTRQRYPYFSVRLCRNDSGYYYEENPLPVVLFQEDGPVRLNGSESNGHLWAVCCCEDRIHLDVYHGLTDGTGMYALLATLLYYYCASRYGPLEHGGVRTLADPVLPGEWIDPQDGISAPPPPSAPPMTPAFTLETDGGLTSSGPTIWDVEIPEDAFLRFTSAHDASPGTMVSLLLARAIDGLYPAREKEIISAYVINARPMLRAELTHHNCLSMAIFPYTDRVRTLPLTTQCTVYRGMTFLQSEEERVAGGMAVNAAGIRSLAESAVTLAEKKEKFGQMFLGGEGLITFLVSYTGKWPHPALGNYIREFWPHPPNTFSLMVEITAAAGKIFLSIQQRFQEDVVREAFLKELERHQIPHALRRVMKSDIASVRDPDGI